MIPLAKKFWAPHVLAVAAFLIISVLYCLPVLQGKLLDQHDFVQWTGMSKDAENFRAENGHYPNWTQGMFSGMPSFQIAFNSNNIIPWLVPRVMGLFMPTPILYFFLSCISFYLLAIVLRLRPIIGVLGALAFAYATYNPVIIFVGHHTKMLSMAMMPAMLAGIYMVLHGKYWIGGALTAIFTGALIAMGHFQIAYYLMLMIALLLASYSIYFLRQKQSTRLFKSISIIVLAALVGVLSNAVALLSTYDYAKATIRGGSALAAYDTSTQARRIDASGLDSAYAMSYSLGIAEPLVMVVPRMFGGSSGEALPEDGALSEAFQSYPGLAQQFPASAYWGGIGGTSGPPYAGALMMALAVFGMFIASNQHRWWMASAVLLSIMLAWGGYFWSFNGLLLEYLPMYNKFRAPSMALVMCQIIIPLLAAVSLNKLVSDHTEGKLDFVVVKKGLIAVGALAIICIAFYLTADYLSSYDQQILKQVREIPDPQTKQVYTTAFEALQTDRKSLAGGDLARSLFFMASAVVLLLAIARKWLKPIPALVLMTGLSFIDLITVDLRYLNHDSYVEVEKDDKGAPVYAELIPSAANLQIMQDKGNYRVFDARQVKVVDGQQRGVDPWSDASQAYHHHMVNGYHAAKLSLYQDLIEKQLSKNNLQAFNMLNTKYFLVNDSRGGDSVVVNASANGNAWFAQKLVPANTPWDEMSALDTIDTKTFAVVSAADMKDIPTPQFDSSASITVKSYGHEKLIYDISTATPQFAVLSEVYYDRGWKAMVDGKEAAIIKTNYALRGIAIPAGTKQLELVFEPKAFQTGFMLTNIFQWLSVIILLLAIFMWWKSAAVKK